MRTGASGIGLLSALLALHCAPPAVPPCAAQTPFTIELEPDLVLGDATGVAFGGGLRLAVDSRGLIYVGDWMNSRVLVFSADGALQETVGRSGGGPGEFRGIHQVVVGRGDSLYVFDASALRLSVYAPGVEHTLAYALPISSVAGQGHPYRIFIPSDPEEGFLVAFKQQSQGTVRVYRVDDEGRSGTRPILEGRGSESSARVGRAGGAVTVTRTAPLFGRGALLGLTSEDELYYGWSDEIDLSFHDLTGRRVGVYRADIRRAPVTALDIAHELEGASEMRRRALEDAEHPETKPALEAVIVDDRSWIWTGRYTADPRVTEWWVTRERGAGASASFALPDDVEIQVVRDGHAYAVAVDEFGAPTVVRYIVRAEPARELR